MQCRLAHHSRLPSRKPLEASKKLPIGKPARKTEPRINEKLYESNLGMMRVLRMHSRLPVLKLLSYQITRLPNLSRPPSLNSRVTHGCLCNCRAETVPAHRTVITRAAKSVALIFLPVIALISGARLGLAGSIRFQLFFRWSERPWVSNAPTGGSSKDLADASAAARLVGAASAFARRKQVSRRPQLPRGNCSRAENSRSHCCQKRVFDCLAHDSLFLSITSRRNECGPAILPAWLPPTGRYLAFLRKK